MSFAEELAMLRKKVKEKGKEVRRLKEENDFLDEASAVSQQAFESQQDSKDENHYHQD